MAKYCPRCNFTPESIAAGDIEWNFCPRCSTRLRPRPTRIPLNTEPDSTTPDLMYY